MESTISTRRDSDSLVLEEAGRRYALSVHCSPIQKVVSHEMHLGTGRIHLRPNTFLPLTESRVVARFWERFFRGSGGSADSFSLIC